MSLLKKLLIAIPALTLAATTTYAQVSLNSVRVGAADPQKVAAFYSKAFGMYEVNRIEMGNNQVELFLNFGDSADKAKANSAAQIVIQQRAKDDSADTVTHVVLTVTDIKATAAALTAAGGTMDRAPFEFGKSGIFVGMGKDPAGNGIELLQFPTQ
jgi:predicted enzyme related to lactoylglutathione lyase